VAKSHLLLVGLDNKMQELVEKHQTILEANAPLEVCGVEVEGLVVLRDQVAKEHPVVLLTSRVWLRSVNELSQKDFRLTLLWKDGNEVCIKEIRLIGDDLLDRHELKLLEDPTDLGGQIDVFSLSELVLDAVLDNLHVKDSELILIKLSV
jgi:hypothetical protein